MEYHYHIRYTSVGPLIEVGMVEAIREAPIATWGDVVDLAATIGRSRPGATIVIDAWNLLYGR